MEAIKALFWMAVLVFIGLMLLAVIGGTGSSLINEANGGCDRNKTVYVGGTFPHTTDECTYMANPFR